MKISELIAQLQKFPQDWEVVQASDEEGNNFHMSRDLGIGWYDGMYHGEFSSWIFDDDEDESSERERTQDECNVVCIWP